MVRRCLAPRLLGLESLPRQGPFLLVANHSAGLGIAESLGLALCWLEAFGSSRPLAPMVFPTDFFIPGMSWFVRRLGAIPSTMSAGEQTLARGVPVLIFPGGDHEAMRPAWQAYRVDFGSRTGFVRLACRSGVPVVPMGIRGAHLTAPLLIRGRWLSWLLVQPRLLGTKRWALSLLGVLGAAALAWAPLPTAARVALGWLWLGSPLSLLPWWPARIRMRIGAPLMPPGRQYEGDEPSRRAFGRRVEQAIQSLVSSADEHERPPLANAPTRG